MYSFVSLPMLLISYYTTLSLRGVWGEHGHTEEQLVALRNRFEASVKEEQYSIINWAGESHSDRRRAPS